MWPNLTNEEKGYIQLSRDSGYTKGIAFDILPSKKILALSVHEYIITSKMRAKNLPKKNACSKKQYHLNAQKKQKILIHIHRHVTSNKL